MSKPERFPGCEGKGPELHAVGLDKKRLAARKTEISKTGRLG